MNPRPISYLKLWLPAALVLIIHIAAAAQSGVSYKVTLDKQPNTHFLHLELRVNTTAPTVDVAMPAWSPGAYNIHNAWRNVQEFSASDDTGASLKFEKVDKQTWRIHRQTGQAVIARYKLYYRNYNDEMCYITGPSVFMYVIGKKPYPVEGPISVKLEPPADWRVQTGLESGSSPNTYVAPDYDTFIDASILTGANWEQTQFDYHGVPHYCVFIGKGNFDEQKITDDTKKVVSYLLDMMGGAPYKKYVFFLRARPGQGSGGLEHLNSTDISFSAYNTHEPKAAYLRFMFVVAHEFFHLFNVKRIRPAILGPFDYSHEQNTRNLYVSEGMTSYWAAVGLKRSGVWSLQDYYDELDREIQRLQSSPGRKVMSVELSSWDTWNRGDNATNNSIDYYNKGELIGNLLDLEIRFRTSNQRSLTDVFLYLFKNHGLPKPGFEEVHGFRDAVETITREAAPSNSDFGDFFRKYVSGTEEIPWNDFFDHAGLMLEAKRDKAHSWIGITTGTALPGAGFFGAPQQLVREGQIAITNVVPGSPAEEAGLDVADVLVSMDGDRIDPATFDARLREKKQGSTIAITVMRRDRLKSFNVRVGQEEPLSYSVKEKTGSGDLQKTIFKSWLSVQ